jgi:hypothetical protein
MLSKNDLGCSHPFGTGIALAIAPPAIFFANIESPELRKASVTSAFIIGFLRSGLSLPYLVTVVGPFMILPNVGLNEWGQNGSYAQ